MTEQPVTEQPAPPPAPPMGSAPGAELLNGDGIKRFTSRTPDKHFFVDDDRFDVSTTMPAEEFAPLLESFTQVGGDVGKQFAAARAIMEASLTEESWARYVPRLSDRKNPIGHVDLVMHAAYVVEVQSERPTGLQQSSTDSLQGTGPVSTGGAPPVV